MLLDNQMSTALCGALGDAQGFAARQKQEQIEIEHVLLACLAQEGVVLRVLRELALDVNYIIKRMEREAESYPKTFSDISPFVSIRLDQALQLGLEFAQSNARAYADTRDFLCGVLRVPTGKAPLLMRSLNLSPEVIEGIARRLSIAQETQNFGPSPIRMGNNAMGSQAFSAPNGGFLATGPYANAPSNPLVNQGFAPANAVLGKPASAAEFKTWRPLQGNFESLRQFTEDWTLLATQQKLRPCIGRESDIRRIMQTLMRKTKNNPIITAESGVGKQTLIMGLAQKIVTGDVPDRLKGVSLLKLDSATVLGGARYKSALEDSFKGILKDIAQSQGKVILYIPNLMAFKGVTTDLINILQPPLTRGDLMVIATGHIRDQKKAFDEISVCQRLFYPIALEEPTTELAITMLKGIKSIYEVHHGVPISDEAVQAAVIQSKRYITTRMLPDKAVDLIDEAAGKVRMEIDALPAEGDAIQREINQIQLALSGLKSKHDPKSEKKRAELDFELKTKIEAFDSFKRRWLIEKEAIAEITAVKAAIERAADEMQQFRMQGNTNAENAIKYGKLIDLQQSLRELEVKLGTGPQLVNSSVGPNQIADTVATWTGIPVAKMMEDEVKKLLAIEENLQKRIIGQNHAVKQIASAVRRSRTGLQDPNRPIGSFIFLGPSGVGKTELGKALAEFLFDDEQAMVRLDMSEYMEKHAASKLIGSPPGYVGHDDGGVLTNAVMEKPYSVVLFDEVEKAHPDTFNILLQLLDDGRLTDSKGQVVDFKNTIVIMTSNLGSRYILELLRTDPDLMKVKVMEALEAHFRPEFLGRIDGKIIFNALSKEDIRKILGLQMRRIYRLLADRELSLELDEAATDFLVEAGYQPEFGARPIKKAIIDYIQETLSTILLERNYPPDTVILATHHEGDDELTFNARLPQTEAENKQIGDSPFESI